MSKKTEQIIRESLADMLGVLSYKVRNGAMGIGDMKAVISLIEESGRVHATVKELASFYRQSEDNVRHVIHRNYLPKPIRRVYYDFLAFREKVPGKWHGHGSLPAD